MNRVRRVWTERRCRQRMRREQQREEYLVMRTVPHARRAALTPAERAAIRTLWGNLNPRISEREYEVFKYIRGFDARYLSHHTYLPRLARTLNQYHYTRFFEHKSLLGYLTPCPIAFPRCLVRGIDGEYYTGDMQQISREQALELCLAESELIVKDSIDTCGGQSVRKLTRAAAAADTYRRAIADALATRSRNFVVQECLRQHPSMARFNPSSINTLRVTTLYLHGRFSVLSVILRFGKAGMLIDNWGAGGIILGVQPSGRLNPTAYDLQLNPYTEYNGVVFADTCIDQLPALLVKLEQAHTQSFSLCKLIGWDVCLNEHNEPVIIELNSSQPGIFCEQIATGPLFGERTQEVIEYCCGKTFSY